MTEFLWAGEDRLSEIVSLWKHGFPDDSDEDIREFWSALKGEARCFMLSEDGEARSMAFVIPAALNGLLIWYVYAAVTARAHRGKGYFAALLNELADRAAPLNVNGLFLRPATPSLFTYYARLGFGPLFYREEIECEASCLYDFDADWQWKPVTEDVAAQRHQWLARLSVSSVTWSAAVTTYAVSLLEDGGVLQSDRGFAMYCRDGDGVRITELLCATEDTAHALATLSRHFTCHLTRVAYPLQMDENAEVYGLFRAIGNAEIAPQKWYMGFSLE